MAKTELLKNLQSRPGTQDNHAIFLTVKDIPIGEIQIKENIRGNYDETELEELAASILLYGLLQPITVYAVEDGHVVKTGHRRFLAYEKLYKKYPERFHSIRCNITDDGNIAVIQLVENIQRADLSQLDLFNALTALREEGMTMKQIAEALGKSEGHIKNQFMGINEIAKDDDLKNLVSHHAVTLKEVAETKSISNKQERLDLLKKRGKREITYDEMTKRVKAIKEGNPVTEPPVADQDCPITPLATTAGYIAEGPAAALDTLANPVTLDTTQAHNSTDNKYLSTNDSKEIPEPKRIQVSVKRQLGERTILVIPNDEDEQTLIIEEDLRAYFTQHEKYCLI